MGDNKEENPLPPNELFDGEYTLFQNKESIKEEDRLYTLEYQFSVQEPSYSTFYSKGNSQIETLTEHDCGPYYEPKHFMVGQIY